MPPNLRGTTGNHTGSKDQKNPSREQGFVAAGDADGAIAAGAHLVGLEEGHARFGLELQPPRATRPFTHLTVPAGPAACSRVADSTSREGQQPLWFNLVCLSSPSAQLQKKENLRVAAQRAPLALVMGWLAYRARRLGLDPQWLLRLQRVAQALFLTTVPHDHPRAPGIELSLSAGSGKVLLTYADHAPTFDPGRHADSPDPEHGGVGLALIRHLPDWMGYRRQDGQNLISLRFAACAQGRIPTL